MIVMKRRDFSKTFGGGLLSLGTLSTSMYKLMGHEVGEMFFKISLAEWSLHKTLFAKKMTNLDFAAKAKNDFGIEALNMSINSLKTKQRIKNTSMN